MKKALVMLLALAMVLPMALALPVNAAAEPDKPFYTLGWSEFDASKYQYLDGLYQLNWGNVGGNVKLSGVTYNEDDPAAMEEQALSLAKTVKKEMDSRPAGARYIHTFGPQKLYRLAPEDAIFMDFAVDQMKVIMDVFLKKYKEIGGQLDGIVVDVEYVGLSVYYLCDTADEEHQPDGLLLNPDLLRNIVKNPKYATEIRPMLEAYGFIFYDAGDAAKQASYTELFSITKNAGSKYSNSRSIWNTVMRNHLNGYVTEWAYEPLQKYFPEANVSDYQSVDTDSWLRLSSVTDDGTEMTGGNSIKAGDTSTYSFYYGQPGSDMYDKLKKYAGYNDAYMPKNNFTQLKYYVNYGKYMYESTDTHKIAPWITYHTYGTEASYRISDSAYYTEQLYHLGMLDPQPFLSYTYKGDSVFSKNGGVDSPHYHEVQQVQNDIMTELTRVAGYSDRQPIASPMDWNSEYMLSGMYAGGRNIWRITPNIHMTSLEDFLVDGTTDPTFSIEGKTVTFPGGKIIADGTVSVVGSCGYWVETAKDVMPIVTTEEDRYEKYPSLLYDFEDYKEGAFDYNTSQPKNAWNFTWKKYGDIKGESKIVTVDGSKKLSIIGNSYNAVKEMSNITAGDNYAKEQTWELTVTIPEGLNKDAKLNLLTYKGNKQEVEDGGFMWQNGKLYYATGEEDAETFELVYKEIMDLKPGTYTFKREMNFHFMDTANYSTFIVEDTAGKELAKVENIASPKFNYITEIGFAVSEADKAVIVDNFKIYVGGIATDFGLYDAYSGQIVKDADMGTARDSSTAYRLSWLNATNEDQTATIKADITSGGKTETKVIKEVKLQAGNDSVVTGIVEIKEGETVKVYLETSVKAPEDPSKPAETEPTAAPTEPQATEPQATEPQATEGTAAPTKATQAPTAATDKKQPTAIRVTRATEPVEEEPTQAPTQKPTKKPTKATEPEAEPTEVTEQTQAPTEETIAPTEETQAPTEETLAPTEATELPDESKETMGQTQTATDDDGGSKVWVIVVIAVVVLAGAGAAVYFFVIKKKK